MWFLSTCSSISLGLFFCTTVWLLSFQCVCPLDLLPPGVCLLQWWSFTPFVFYSNFKAAAFAVSPPHFEKLDLDFNYFIKLPFLPTCLNPDRKPMSVGFFSPSPFSTTHKKSLCEPKLPPGVEVRSHYSKLLCSCDEHRHSVSAWLHTRFVFFFSQRR